MWALTTWTSSVSGFLEREMLIAGGAFQTAGGAGRIANKVARWVQESDFDRGEVNGDGRVDLADSIFVLNCLFADGSEPGCMKSADANDDGRIDLGDVIYVLSYLFADGPEPPVPFGECGPDPTPDDLTCVSPGQC